MSEGAFDEFDIGNKELDIAPIYIRVIAFVIDIVIYYLLSLAFGILFGKHTNVDTFGFSLTGFPALMLLLITLFLWPVSEGIYGQTIGKRFMDIRVIANKNKKMTIGRGLIRFFVGLLDMIFLIGIVVAIFDNNSNRIGDIIANTVVVKNKYNG
ncbi:RDD family protein [Tenacibaculum sp. M341]|uniref:RDD family protein n=1 Tax=Tenacibaculum sp. M341 TaxID=2530339 RepID=UPI0010473B9D|nr:RDD family protein [Tenacibaculum sp. M341]TCI85105.1 RDD family protein [Tenacibaculum sp. M341]